MSHNLDPELVARFTRILGAGEEPNTWSAMMKQVAEDCMSDFDGEVPGAGGCCEVGGDEEKGLNATELGILKVGINYLITDHYANRDILRQSLEELSDKLDRMIGEANTKG